MEQKVTQHGEHDGRRDQAARRHGLVADPAHPVPGTDREKDRRDVFALAQLLTAFVGVALGLLSECLGESVLAGWMWGGATLAVLVPTAYTGLRALFRGKVGVDVIAVLAMTMALGMHEELAGAVVAAMVVSGDFLERFAARRARRTLDALLAHAPHVVHRLEKGQITDLDVDQVARGDLLVVMAGEVVPADGTVISGTALLDESALTGESRPSSYAAGAVVRSGAVNAGSTLELRVVRPPEESTYAGIVRMVASAAEQKAPFQRMADRYAFAFLLLTLGACLAAWWITGDLSRALAVLVVATPCPLIIAVPVALIGGVSRAGRSGVLIRGSAVLEALDGVQIVLLDKTGTLTTSQPEVSSVHQLGSHSVDEILRLSASLEQYSVHPFAPAIVAAANLRHLGLELAKDTFEKPGLGISGYVEGQSVAVGQLSWVAPGPPPPAVRALVARSNVEGSSAVYVCIAGELAGALIMHNPIRPEAPRVIERLRRDGIRAVHIVTGDHPDVAELVGDALGADRVFAERTPAEKVEIVQLLASEGKVLMVGDGINDAPALALADVGVAMGARGATAAASAADVVLIADRLDGLLVARKVARRTMQLARQSVTVGMGLSLLAMLAAAFGAFTPVQGAILQEIIDVTVILMALRILRGDVRPLPAPMEALATDLRAAHLRLRPQIDDLANLAGQLGALAPAEARSALVAARERLERELWPHEVDEQQSAYPVIRMLTAPDDPTASLIHTHHEIRRLTRLLDRLIARLPPAGPEPADLHDLRRLLYGLQAVLSLHVAQEEQLYSMFDAR